MRAIDVYPTGVKQSGVNGHGFDTNHVTESYLLGMALHCGYGWGALSTLWAWQSRFA